MRRSDSEREPPTVTIDVRRGQVERVHFDARAAVLVKVRDFDIEGTMDPVTLSRGHLLDIYEPPVQSPLHVARRSDGRPKPIDRVESFPNPKRKEK